MSKLRYWEHGYSKIHPLYSKGPWQFSIQLHKNGRKHYDIRLRRPEEELVYSWATRKFPFPKKGVEVPVFRTRDHSLESMSFEGVRVGKKGKAEKIKILEKGPIKMLSIDDQGLTFEYAEQKYRLRPHEGKKYKFEQLEDI